MKRRKYLFVTEREKRLMEIAKAEEQDAMISQAIEDTVEHCSVCGLPITDEAEHSYCVATMRSKWQPLT